MLLLLHLARFVKDLIKSSFIVQFYDTCQKNPFVLCLKADQINEIETLREFCDIWEVYMILSNANISLAEGPTQNEKYTNSDFKDWRPKGGIRKSTETTLARISKSQNSSRILCREALQSATAFNSCRLADS